MVRVDRQKQREALYGWLKWTPVLAMVFSALFVDTWLNTQMRADDYRLGQLNVRLRELRNTMSELRVQESRLEKQDRLVGKAQALALKTPDPSQVVVLQVKEAALVYAREEVEWEEEGMEKGAKGAGRADAFLARLHGLAVWAQAKKDGLRVAEESGSEAEGAAEGEAKEGIFQKLSLDESLANLLDRL